MKIFLLGAVAMASLGVSLFFLRFWKTTHDRFFLFFAASFLIEAVERAMMAVIPYSNEQEPLFYLLRLLAFVLILYAIIDKNRLAARKN
jgi:hypothetical protein